MATVAKLVEKELKAILQRDINKKLCESYAFLLFDKWWADKVSHNQNEILVCCGQCFGSGIGWPPGSGFAIRMWIRIQGAYKELK
jgi:hypothetical protein